MLLIDQTHVQSCMLSIKHKFSNGCCKSCAGTNIGVFNQAEVVTDVNHGVSIGQVQSGMM